MILYQLGCACGHDFESWFRDSASFDALAASKLLSCPRCAADTVSKRLMAPSVRTARAARPASPPTAAPSASTPPAGIGTPSKAPAAPVPGAPAAPPAMPDELRAALQRIRREVEKQCDDVGDRFADEAIRIHHGDAPRRGIYGNTTEDDRERLRDEGVETVAIPWLKPAEG